MFTLPLSVNGGICSDHTMQRALCITYRLIHDGEIQREIAEQIMRSVVTANLNNLEASKRLSH